MPSILQGVLISNRCALIGAAVFLALFAASITVGTTLLIPAITITLSGPNVIAATLLPMPSMFTNSPVSVMAFVPVKNTSHVNACLMIAVRSSGVFALFLSNTL